MKSSLELPLTALSLVGSLALAVFYYFYLGFLSNTSEHKDLPSIVKTQQETNAVYHPFLYANAFNYKLELIKQVKPKVVVLGSSRSWKFRKEFFVVHFC